MRLMAMLLPVAIAVPAVAQVDPATVAQGQVLSATARGYAERDAARRRGGVPRPTAAQRRQAQDCVKLWAMRERMNRTERRRLYDLCPR